MLEDRILLCEHLDSGLCRAVKENQEGRIVRHDLCANEKRYSCCYTCSRQTSCEIECDYLSESKKMPSFQANADDGIEEFRSASATLSAIAPESEMEKEMQTGSLTFFDTEMNKLIAGKQGCLVSQMYFKVLTKRIMRTGKERKLLSAVDAKAILCPEYGPGESLLSFSRFFLGVIPRYFMTKAFIDWTKSELFAALRDDSNVEQGEITDIVDKQAKLTELTLTNRNFLLLYEKGLMSKQQKLIVFPLEHAKTVTHEGDHVKVGYEVFQEGKDY
jgi:hypothetical protein